MNALVGLGRVLPKAALIGGLMGMGAECAENFTKEGRRFLAFVVAAVALQTMAHFFGWGAAVGALCGVVIPPLRSANIITDLGYAILGGTFGYLVEAATRGLPVVIAL